MKKLSLFDSRAATPFSFLNDDEEFENFGLSKRDLEFIPVWSSGNRWGIKPEARSKHFLKTDIKETETGYKVVAEVPGVPKNAIDIMTNNRDHTVTVKVEESKEYSTCDKDTTPEDEDTAAEEGSPEKMAVVKHLCKERYEGSFSRTFSMPKSCDLDSADAKLENGLLYVTFDKSKDSARTINIK